MACQICGHNYGQMIEAEELMFGMKDKFKYFLCLECGCLQLKDIPINMGKYYPDSYYSFAPDLNSYSYEGLSGKVRKLRDKYAVFNKGILGRLMFKIKPNATLRCLAYANITEESKILDVGCGNGKLLNILRGLGFKELLGIDPYVSEPIRYYKGVVIEKREILQQTGQWDLIMLHHSLEHIEKQKETMKAINELLSPEGIAIIRIPILPSFAWEKYREKWVQLDAPRHFYIHSIESIRRLGYFANLELVKIIYDSTELQFIGSEQYESGITLRGAGSYYTDRATSIFSSSQVKKFQKKAWMLNKEENGDQAIFYFQKIKR